MVFALLIPAEWQILALRVQLDMCDPLFEEYNCPKGYPEYNRLHTSTEIRHWGLQLCIPRKQSGRHGPKVNLQ